MAKKQFGNIEYIADSANPNGIEEFKKQNLNCKGAEKFKGEREESFVVSGIKRISSLLKQQQDGKPRLFIDRSCVNTIMELENYRYPDPKEEHPIQEKPLKIHDHCLVAGTKVFTKDGEKNIENIETGEFVLTRDGFKKVLKSGKTIENAIVYEIKMNNGRNIIGTGNHPIYVKNEGFISMDSMRYKFKLENIKNNIWFKTNNNSISILKEPNIVQVVAKRQLSEKKDVYNLIVEDKPEFYANGILVHNSMDALRYLLGREPKKFIVDLV